MLNRTGSTGRVFLTTDVLNQGGDFIICFKKKTLQYEICLNEKVTVKNSYNEQCYRQLMVLTPEIYFSNFRYKKQSKIEIISRKCLSNRFNGKITVRG